MPFFRRCRSPFGLTVVAALLATAAGWGVVPAARAAGPSFQIGLIGDTGYSAGQDADLGVLGWVEAAKEAYEAASWGPEDADLGEVYDSYAAVLAIALEGLAISPPGEAAREFHKGRFSPGGQFPLNTNGGLLSAGHTGVGGGTALLIEGIRQLLHRAGPDRQVPNARHCIVGGTGGSYMDAQIMMLERATR